MDSNISAERLAEIGQAAMNALGETLSGKALYNNLSGALKMSDREILEAGFVSLSQYMTDCKYAVRLHYGWETTEGGTEISHAFQMEDANEPPALGSEVDGNLMEMLDTDREHFTSGIPMWLALPITLVERIKRDAIIEYQEKEKQGKQP